MGFRFHGSSTRGKHYILIVDNSASMAAKDVKPSRLEWAKQEALKTIDAASDDSVGMVIAFNSKAVTLQGYTTDATKLRDAVRTIEQTNCTTRIDDALSLADSLANQVRSTEDQASQPEGPVEPGRERQYVAPKGLPTDVYLFSDGRFPELSESSLSKLNSLLAGNTSTLGNLQLHFQLAGVPGPENVNNVGIIAFNVVRYDRDNPKRKDPNALKLQAFVHVRNFRPKECDVKLVLDVESDGKLIHSGQQTLALAKRTVTRQKSDKDSLSKDEPGDAQAIFDLPQLDLRSSTILKTSLKDVDDDFDKDDAAWLVVGMVRKAKVLIVTNGNRVLESFFRQEATQKVATIHTLTPEDLTKDSYLTTARGGQLDLVIFDRCARQGGGHARSEHGVHRPSPTAVGTWLQDAQEPVFGRQQKEPSAFAEYHDSLGCRHQRSLSLSPHRQFVNGCQECVCRRGAKGVPAVARIDAVARSHRRSAHSVYLVARLFYRPGDDFSAH